jgi:hypothetical protein
MISVNQRFPAHVVADVGAAVRQRLEQAGLAEAIRPGARIAVCSGSRGIANIAQITRTVVDAVKSAGGEPFILPAMGSHGGATPAGQKQVLAGYGIDPTSMGCPVEATMDVVQVEQLDDGTPVLVNRLALESDGVVLINRIKPHTSFRGPFESGLMKMMTIGLGSHKGATIAHAHPRGLGHLIPAWGGVILRRAPVLMGVAIIENAYDQTAQVEALSPAQFGSREPELLCAARLSMARLLVRNIDLLIVDEIGKDISGTGMDTNVIGRMLLPGIPEPDEPGVRRIVCLGLTDKTHGNANGVGLADIITRRLYSRIDFQATYANVFTTTFLNRANIPVILETDRRAIEQAVEVLCLDDSRQARIVRIHNTLELARIQVSEPLLADVKGHPDITADGDPQDMCFDGAGTLI